MRFCVHCQKPIPDGVMVRGRYKAIFCSAECRLSDRNVIRARKKADRVLKGCCRTCGKKLSSARVQTQPEGILEDVQGEINAALGSDVLG